MADVPTLFVHVRHAYAAQGPGVGKLSPALGEKGREVEHDTVTFLFLTAVDDDRVKGEKVTVLVIELFGHGVSLPVDIFMRNKRSMMSRASMIIKRIT